MTMRLYVIRIDAPGLLEGRGWGYLELALGEHPPSRVVRDAAGATRVLGTDDAVRYLATRGEQTLRSWWPGARLTPEPADLH